MVDVQVNKDSIEIKAEMKDEKENKGKNYLHRERTYSSVQRDIAFPEEVVSGQDRGIHEGWNLRDSGAQERT